MVKSRRTRHEGSFSSDHYEDMFVNVMEYAVLKIDDTGTQRRIKTKEDLVELFKELNRLEAKKDVKKQDGSRGKKTPSLSDNFIKSILDTKNVEEALRTGKQKVTYKQPALRGYSKEKWVMKDYKVGNFGEVMIYAKNKKPVDAVATPRETQKIIAARQKGLPLYRYNGGYATSYSFKRKDGEISKRFRDIDRGIFVSKKKIEEEL